MFLDQPMQSYFVYDACQGIYQVRQSPVLKWMAFLCLSVIEGDGCPLILLFG